MRILRIAALVAAAKYFFDPQNGSQRRAMARERVMGLVRGLTGRSKDLAAEARSASEQIQQLRAEEGQPDDVTLARKVETEIFRDPDVPKGQINVNAQNGVVQLRGEVDRPDMIEELERKTREVQGVEDVENLLHTPGEPAPMHE